MGNYYSWRQTLLHYVELLLLSYAQISKKIFWLLLEMKKIVKEALRCKNIQFWVFHGFSSLGFEFIYGIIHICLILSFESLSGFCACLCLACVRFSSLYPSCSTNQSFKFIFYMMILDILLLGECFWAWIFCW